MSSMKINCEKLHRMRTQKNDSTLWTLLVLQNTIKTIPKPKGPGGEQKPKVPTLEQLLEYLSHGEVSDDNFAYCAITAQA